MHAISSPPLLVGQRSAGRWVIEVKDSSRIIWLLPPGTPETHMLRLLYTAFGLINRCGLEAPLEKGLLGTWPGGAVRAPFAEISREAAAPVQAEELREALIRLDIPEPAAGAPIVLTSVRKRRPSKKFNEILSSIAAGGLTVLDQAGLDVHGKIARTFEQVGPIGIFAFQAPCGCPAKNLEKACEEVMQGVLQAEPDVLAPWSSFPQTGDKPVGPIAIIPADEITGPALLAFCRITDSEKMQFALNLILAADEGRLFTPSKTVS